MDKRFSCSCGQLQKSVIDRTKVIICQKCGTPCTDRPKRVVQESLEAFIKLDEIKLSPRRKLVLDAIKKLDKPNNREIAEFLRLPINCITGRVKELREGNNPLVIEAGFKVDTITQEKTKAWRIA